MLFYHRAMPISTNATPMLLITNDDGISSPGLHALWQALAPLAEIVVVAPERNWSAGGHSRTFEGILRLDAYTGVPAPPGVRLFTSNGTPADCVALAMMGAVEQCQPTMVVSGVNRGPNLGQDVTYSGTVAAALEAAIWGLPALAISLDRAPGVVEDFTAAVRAAARLVAHLLRAPAPSLDQTNALILNVNAPALPASAVQGIKWTRLGRRVYRDALVQRTDPHGRPYFWVGGLAPSGDIELVGTDIWAIHHGYVSVTPIKLDMTDDALLEILHRWDFEST